MMRIEVILQYISIYNMNSLENIVAPYTVSERMLCSLYDSLTGNHQLK